MASASTAYYPRSSDTPSSSQHQKCFGLEISNTIATAAAGINASTLTSNRTNGSSADALIPSISRHDFSGLDGFPITSLMGVLMPAFCILGILGNVLNLAVLTRPNMKSVSHIYMRGTWGISSLLSTSTRSTKLFWAAC